MLSTEPANWARHRSDGRFVATLFAVVAPLNLAFNVPPSATVLNQATAWLGWGAAVTALLLGRANVAEAGMPSGVRPITGVLVLVIGAALTSVAWTGLPWSLALSAAGTASAGLVIALAGARCTTAGFAADADGGAMTGALCWGLAVAGSIASLIALIQTYVPAWADGDWIALPSGSRVGANLRQPNHLATLLLWSAIALVWLGHRRRRVQLRLDADAVSRAPGGLLRPHATTCRCSWRSSSACRWPRWCWRCCWALWRACAARAAADGRRTRRRAPRF